MIADLARLEEWWEDLEPLLPELAEAIPLALEPITRGRDDIVSVALFTDDAVMTLAPAALSAGHEQANAEESPDLADYLPWVVDEWDIFAEDDTPLDDVMAKLVPLREAIDEDEWFSFMGIVNTWMVKGMGLLADRGWFEANYPGARVSFWITDFEDHPENIIEWMLELNPPERVEAYARYLRTYGA